MDKSLFYFLQWEYTKLFATLAVLYFFPSVLVFFFAQKKYYMAKVENIFVDSNCKKKNKNSTVTAQWILLKLGQKDLLSKNYNLVLVSRNAFFGDNNVALVVISHLA